MRRSALNVVSFPYGPMPTQPLGWFKKPITSVDDFKGIKYRTVGISIDMFTAMGAAVNALPGGEIVSAMDRGLLDAAEFNNASSDRLLGFADVSKVCMLQSYHQNAEQLEITFNKTKYDALPDKMKAIIANAVSAASQEMQWKAIDRYSQDYIELQTKDKVKFYKTPDSILKRQLEIYDEVVKKYCGDKSAVQGDRRIADRRSPSGRRNGNRTPSSAARWRSITTSDRTRRSRSDGTLNRQSTVRKGDRMVLCHFDALLGIIGGNQ